MALAGKVVVFSGTLTMKRADAKKQAGDAGATVGSGVTAKTDILVAASDVAGKKVSDAQSKGVEIWTESDFVAACSGKKRGRSKKAAAPVSAAAPAAAAKKAKASSMVAGLSGVSAPSFAGGGGGSGSQLDAGVAKVDNALASAGTLHVGSDGDPMDAKLAQVDLAQNTDKYYVLQLIDSNNGSEFFVYSRWGRTGTAGQSRVEGPHGLDEAVKGFEKIYKSKTGGAWGNRNVGGTAAPGSYTHLSVGLKSGKAGGRWEYYLTNDPMGKADGWHAYDDKAGAQTEELYCDHEENPATMAVRFVYAETVGFTYKVDLIAEEQTNTKTSKVRPIRRIPPVQDAAAAPLSSTPLVGRPVAKKAATKKTATKKKKAAAPKKPTITKVAKPAKVAVSKAKPKKAAPAARTTTTTTTTARKTSRASKK